MDEDSIPVPLIVLLTPVVWQTSWTGDIEMAEAGLTLNEDGTARDPAAFQQVLRSDPVKLAALEKEPEVAKIILGEDTYAVQELLKSVYEVGERKLRSPSLFAVSRLTGRSHTG